MTTTGQQHIKHIYVPYTRAHDKCLECRAGPDDPIHIKPNESTVTPHHFEPHKVCARCGETDDHACHKPETAAHISDATLSPELEKRAKQIHDKPHDTELLICALYNALQAERAGLKAISDHCDKVVAQREEWMRIAAVRESARVQAEASASAYKQSLDEALNGNAHIDVLQQRALATAIYPGQGTVAGLIYCVLGLNGEAGEVAEHAKKILRDDNAVITSERRPKIKKELGDAWWYLCGAAREAGFTMLEIANANAEKLSARQQAGTLQGSGSER